MAVEREEAYAEGVSQGISQGINKGMVQAITRDILDLLEDLGNIPEDIITSIQAEGNPDTLRRWHRAAARAKDFTDFRKKMQ